MLSRKYQFSLDGKRNQSKVLLETLMQLNYGSEVPDRIILLI
jgi:hypothetical protein